MGGGGAGEGVTRRPVCCATGGRSRQARRGWHTAYSCAPPRSCERPARSAPRICRSSTARTRPTRRAPSSWSDHGVGEIFDTAAGSVKPQPMRSVARTPTRSLGKYADVSVTTETSWRRATITRARGIAQTTLSAMAGLVSSGTPATTRDAGAVGSLASTRICQRSCCAAPQRISLLLPNPDRTTSRLRRPRSRRSTADRRAVRRGVGEVRRVDIARAVAHEPLPDNVERGGRRIGG